MKDDHPTQNALPSHKGEKVLLESSFGTKKRGFAAFLIGCALLIAAFAITALWMEGTRSGIFGNRLDATSNSADQSQPTDSTSDTGTQSSSPSAEIPARIPDGATPVVSRDLSCLSLGFRYLHNETDYLPDWDALLQMRVGESLESSAPRVLIIHTHSSEGYLEDGSFYMEGNIGDATYSQDERKNVLSVGAMLCQTLNECGVPTLHCRILHDEPGLSGAYNRSAETVREYLASYPSIEYVIDLHRDSVMSADGELVRSECSVNGEATAQVMAVVGSDRNGTEYPNGWEQNLALALQLREALNTKAPDLCRPVSLRTQSFHQELGAYGLLLEIGTAANSPTEAKRAAVLVGEALANLIQAR